MAKEEGKKLLAGGKVDGELGGKLMTPHLNGYARVFRAGVN